MSFRNSSVQLILAAKVLMKTKVETNLFDADKIITVRLRDLEKTYAHVNKNCYHQTWTATSPIGTISVQTNLNGTDDTTIQRSRGFAKVKTWCQ